MAFGFALFVLCYWFKNIVLLSQPITNNQNQSWLARSCFRTLVPVTRICFDGPDCAVYVCRD